MSSDKASHAGLVTYSLGDADPEAFVGFDLSGGDPEKFPIDALPDNLRAIVENLSETYQVPVCLPAMSALATMSGAVGKSVVVRGAYRDKSTHLNIYVVAGAERGSGKGNTSILTVPIATYSRAIAEEWKQSIAMDKATMGVLKKEIQAKEQNISRKPSSIDREQEIEQLRQKQAELAELEDRARRRVALWADNSTSEAALLLLQDNNEELFIFSAEAAGALRVSLGKYTKSQTTDFDWLLSAYSGDSMRVNRIGREAVELTNPCLALLWMAQPCVLRELMGYGEAIERGLTARILMFDSGARREHDNRKDVSFTKVTEWTALINDILDRRLRGEARELACPPEVREVFSAFDDESVILERDAFSDVAGELSRWRENAIKVAGLLALSEGVDSLTVDHAHRGCDIVRWAGFNYLSMLSEGRRDRKRRELDRLLDLLHESGGALSLGALNRNHGMKREPILAIMAAFPDALEIIKTPQADGKAGRPAETLKIKHP